MSPMVSMAKVMRDALHTLVLAGPHSELIVEVASAGRGMRQPLYKPRYDIIYFDSKFHIRSQNFPGNNGKLSLEQTVNLLSKKLIDTITLLSGPKILYDGSETLRNQAATRIQATTRMHTKRKAFLLHQTYKPGSPGYMNAYLDFLRLRQERGNANKPNNAPWKRTRT